MASAESLTPIEYVQFRDLFGKASGFQSPQDRTVEFLLGNKNPAMIKVFDHDEELRAALQADLEAASLYDEFLASSPDAVTRCQQPCSSATSRSRTWRTTGSSRCSGAEMCEELVDVEGTFQLWRFRHLKTVERIIGFKRGTGGSSGSQFLRKALELTFFPELLDVRTHIGA